MSVRIGWLAVAAALAGCGGDDDPTKPRSVAYACEQGVAVTVIFNPVSRLATIRGLGPQDVLLPARETGSGFRYATDRVELRGQGAEAIITVDGASVACRAETPAGAG